MAYTNISGIRQTFVDGNIDRSDPNIVYNNSICVIDTATKGPAGVPVRIENLSDIETLFGSYAESPLSRKLKQAWNATFRGNGIRQIYGVRLTGGLYGSLYIPEMSLGSTVNDYNTSDADYSIKLTAKYPGYLPVTVRRDTSDGKQAVIIYNPDTDVESIFTYDNIDLNNTSVDVHTASELATAINADPNLNSVISAEIADLNAKYELKISNSGTYSDGYSSVGGYSYITLTDVGATSGIIDHTNNLYDGQAKVAPSSARNLIKDVTSIYEISTVVNQLIDGKGSLEFTLTAAPITDPDYTGISKIVDIDGEYSWPTSTPYAEYRQIVRNRSIGTIIDDSTLSFTTELYLAPDVYGGSTAWASAQADSSYVGAISGYSWTDVARSGSSDNTTDHIIVYYSRNGTTIPIARSNYTVEWTHSGGSGTTPEMTITLDSSLYSSGTIKTGDTILVDVDTVTGILYEQSNIATVENTQFYNYFISGKKIIFGATLPTAIEISYTYARKYTIGENVELSDSYYGEFKFTDRKYTLGSIGDSEVISGSTRKGTGFPIQWTHPIEAAGVYLTQIPQASEMHAGTYDMTNGTMVHRDSQPSVTNAAFTIGATHDGYTRIGLLYSYEPEWPNITETSLLLEGGTSGINISNDDKYNELEDVFEKIKNTPFDIYVLGSMYLDDTKERNNPITGIVEDVNAEFHILFHSFLKDINTDEGAAVGIMAVKNPTDYKQETINDWVNKLTVIDARYPNQAAFVMNDFATNYEFSKFIGVVAMPVITNYLGTNYITTAEAIVAGMYSSLSTEDGLNFRTLQGITGVPYPIQATMADKIAGSNFITFRYDGTYGYVVASDPTVQGDSSDYNTLSTVKAVMTTVSDIRRILKSFLGKKYTQAIQSAMDQQVKKAIKDKIALGILNSGTGILTSTPRQQAIGYVLCSLNLYPAFAIRNFEIKTQVKL